MAPWNLSQKMNNHLSLPAPPHLDLSKSIVKTTKAIIQKRNIIEIFMKYANYLLHYKFLWLSLLLLLLLLLFSCLALMSESEWNSHPPLYQLSSWCVANSNNQTNTIIAINTTATITSLVITTYQDIICHWVATLNIHSSIFYSSWAYSTIFKKTKFDRGCSDSWATPCCVYYFDWIFCVKQRPARIENYLQIVLEQ